MRARCLLLLPMIFTGCTRKEEPAGGAKSHDQASPVIDAAPPAASSAVPDAEVADVADTPPAEVARPFRREDWDISIGKWNFEDGEVSCECKGTSSLLYFKPAKPKDFDASVELQFLSDESSAGIIFRERGEDFYEDATFYQFEWYTRGTHHDKRLSLMIKNPYWVQIVTPKFPEAPLGKWIKLRVRAEGDHLQNWIDDELVFDKRDQTFVRSGKIGLHIFQPRKIKLRDFRLTVLDNAH